ncbi:hypothetical protein Tco_1107343 [Tanacetum coccineum]
MASDGSDQEAVYALSMLLQMGTVEDYQREFEMFIKLVTIPESLLKLFYISGLKLDLQCLLLRSNPKTLDEAFSLACAAETRFANLEIYEFLRSNPSTLGEDFFKARITEARFEIIAKEEKEHIVEKKIDVILPLQSEFASPKAKGSLNADEYIGVVEVVMGGGEGWGTIARRVAGGRENGKAGKRRVFLCYVQGERKVKKKKSRGGNSKRLWGIWN